MFIYMLFSVSILLMNDLMMKNRHELDTQKHKLFKFHSRASIIHVVQNKLFR